MLHLFPLQNHADDDDDDDDDMTCWLQIAAMEILSYT